MAPHLCPSPTPTLTPLPPPPASAFCQVDCFTNMKDGELNPEPRFQVWKVMNNSLEGEIERWRKEGNGSLGVMD